MTQKFVERILAHHGVKGMKWGVKKSEFQNAGYSRSDRDLDRAVFGSRGVARINRRMNQGRTYKQASRAEHIRYISMNTAIIGAGVAAKILITAGPTLGKDISSRAETNRGRAQNARKYGLGPDSTIASKQNRNGTYNVTSM